MTKEPVVLTREDWAREADQWVGRATGAMLDAEVTVLFFSSDVIGDGPPLHTHPYDEAFIIRQGRGRFTIGDVVVEADAGQILMAPAEIPHKFENLGPGRLETTDIHLSREFIQVELE